MVSQGAVDPACGLVIANEITSRPLSPYQIPCLPVDTFFLPSAKLVDMKKVEHSTLVR